jgi:hypothetical protein
MRGSASWCQLPRYRRRGDRRPTPGSLAPFPPKLRAPSNSDLWRAKERTRAGMPCCRTRMPDSRNEDLDERFYKPSGAFGTEPQLAPFHALNSALSSIWCRLGAVSEGACRMRLRAPPLRPSSAARLGVRVKRAEGAAAQDWRPTDDPLRSSLYTCHLPPSAALAAWVIPPLGLTCPGPVSRGLETTS